MFRAYVVGLELLVGMGRLCDMVGLGPFADTYRLCDMVGLGL